MSTVTISEYLEEWPVIFKLVRQEILEIFAPDVASIEHIGSTSVPGLSAKPVIDVLLGAIALHDVESRIELLGRYGYAYFSEYEQQLPMRRFFVKTPAASLRVHVHAVELGSSFWKDHLAFRDLLRQDADLRSNYQALKLRLAQEHSHDRAAYSAAKGPFIQAALAVTKGGSAN